MLVKSIIVITVVAITATGCSANRYSISRSTRLPPAVDGSGKPGGGVAIHLDAQQRLVLSNADGVICAEPSPDAMTTFAASFGAGASVPDKAAASVAQALQGSIGSIGLRTQSITLMRDALYRMCEAYANDKIGGPQLATFYSRSQDLTAVILAVEQLTGAVAANQVILTGSSNANSTASLVSNQQLLDVAEKDVKTKTEALAEATTARDEAKKAAERKEEADADVRKQAETDLAKAEDNRKSAEKSLAESKRTLEAVKAARESALANAAAGTSGSGEFSIPVQRNQLDKEATMAIATAIETMVTEVLKKPYIVENCLAYLTADKTAALAPAATRKPQDSEAGETATRRMCQEVVIGKLSDPAVRKQYNID